jgi:predicted permease
MSILAAKFAIMGFVMAASMLGGYLCQRKGWVLERAGERIMTFVAVFGYPTVGFFSIWGTTLKNEDALLPFLAVAHTVLMTFISMGLARLFTRDRGETGLFAIAGGLGNNGFTMGAFVLYLLYGEPAMGLANVYFVLFSPMVVLLMYPIARVFAAETPQGSLGGLIYRSIFDWRSIGLPLSLAAIGLSVSGVPRPPQIQAWRLMDILVYTITPLAFFGIGLRLHLSKFLPLWKAQVWLAGVRFAGGAVAALILAWLTHWTPWPFHDLRWKVYVIEGFVPTAVTMVAVANMFGLRPREASVLFVGNTLLYLVFVLPVVFLIFRY